MLWPLLAHASAVFPVFSGGSRVNLHGNNSPLLSPSAETSVIRERGNEKRGPGEP